jgi:hypothetical protein
MMIPSESGFSTQGYSGRATPSIYGLVFEATKSIMITSTSSMPYGTNIGGPRRPHLKPDPAFVLICPLHFPNISDQKHHRDW